MTPSSSAMEWFVLCPVDASIFPSNFKFMHFVMFLFRVHVSHPYNQQLELCMFVLFVTSFCYLLPSKGSSSVTQ